MNTSVILAAVIIFTLYYWYSVREVHRSYICGAWTTSGGAEAYAITPNKDGRGYVIISDSATVPATINVAPSLLPRRVYASVVAGTKIGPFGSDPTPISVDLVCGRMEIGDATTLYRNSEFSGITDR